MTPLRALLTIIAALMCLCLSGSAEAAGRSAATPSIYSLEWRIASSEIMARRPTRHAIAPRPRLLMAAKAPPNAFVTRHSASAPDLYAPGWRDGAPAIAAGAAWRAGQQAYTTGSRLVAEALSTLGSGKFTPYAGPWCADAVNAWLQHVGKPPLDSRYAGAALSYGPRGSGSPGELAVFMGRRGAYHVGVVVADLGDRVEVVSGNWSHRVGRAVISRRALVFVRT